MIHVKQGESNQIEMDVEILHMNLSGQLIVNMKYIVSGFVSGIDQDSL